MKIEIRKLKDDPEFTQRQLVIDIESAEELQLLWNLFSLNAIKNETITSEKFIVLKRLMVRIASFLRTAM